MKQLTIRLFGYRLRVVYDPDYVWRRTAPYAGLATFAITSGIMLWLQ